MSQDTDRVPHSFSSLPVTGSDSVDPSCRYDNMIIADRPLSYSISEPLNHEGNNDSGIGSFREAPNTQGKSRASDPIALIDKLKSEIAHLENWLAQQMESRHRSLSLVSTIRSLIATRKSLLKSLLDEQRMRL